MRQEVEDKEGGKEEEEGGRGEREGAAR